MFLIVMFCHITYCDVLSYYLLWCSVMLLVIYAILLIVMFCHITYCDVLSYYLLWCFVILLIVMLYHYLLWCSVILLFVMFCHITYCDVISLLIVMFCHITFVMLYHYLLWCSVILLIVMFCHITYCDVILLLIVMFCHITFCDVMSYYLLQHFMTDLRTYDFLSLLSALAKLRKATINFLVSLRLPIWNNSAPTARILMKFYSLLFFENLFRKFNFRYNRTKITLFCMKTNTHF
jgi:hypothetical protein